MNGDVDHKSSGVMLIVCERLVQPQLEYCAQFWVPHERKDVNTPGKGKKRFTGMVPGRRNFSFEVFGEPVQAQWAKWPLSAS